MPPVRASSPLRLEDLVEGLPINLTPTTARDHVITHMTDDSRQVVEGSLFVARPGTRTDGARFIEVALAAGAAAVLVAEGAEVDRPCDAVLRTADVPRMAAILAERLFGNPSQRLQLIGVTGTNGKTTVAYLIRQILTHAKIQCGLIGTVEVDDGALAQPATLTTPGCIELSQTLARMVANRCRACVMEVSSHALLQQRTAGLNFDIAVFTNLSGDHLDYHATLEAYADAKAILFDDLSPSATAIVNADDTMHGRMIRDTKASVVRAATAPNDKADASAKLHHADVRGSDVSLRFSSDFHRLRLPLLGKHNIENALHAAIACSRLGVADDVIIDALQQASAPPGRYEPVAGDPDKPLVLVDYAHTDDALENALTGLRPLVPEGGRLIAVFGCGGDRDRTKRPRMAQVACRGADVVYITSDNPRTEDPASIIDEVQAGVPTDTSAVVHTVVDRAEAIDRAIRSSGPSDIVLIAGKGHEDYQIIGTTRQPFDDRLVAAASLRSLELQPA